LNSRRQSLEELARRSNSRRDLAFYISWNYTTPDELRKYITKVELNSIFLKFFGDVYGNVSVSGEVSNGSLVPQKNPALLIGRPQLAGFISVFVVVIVGKVAGRKIVHASFSIETTKF